MPVVSMWQPRWGSVTRFIIVVKVSETEGLDYDRENENEEKGIKLRDLLDKEVMWICE